MLSRPVGHVSEKFLDHCCFHHISAIYHRIMFHNHSIEFQAGPVTFLNFFLDFVFTAAPACHGAGTIAMLFFVFNSYSVNDYWYIFGFCVALPAVVEIFTFLSFLLFRPRTMGGEDSSKSSWTIGHCNVTDLKIVLQLLMPTCARLDLFIRTARPVTSVNQSDTIVDFEFLL